MNNALLSGVTGLSTHQRMLDVSGNNLANVNTMGFKSSRVTFAELLSNTLKQASQPTANLGGTNPIQVGSGVMLASVDRNVSQGILTNTGKPLDLGIEGAGYFVLNDGTKDVFTRVGAFEVDSDFYLVDPATGYHVQRIGSEGEAEGFQDSAIDNIFIPYNTSLPARATESISYSRNLDADAYLPTTNILTSGLAYTEGNAIVTDLSTQLDALDQTSGLNVGDTMTVTGYKRDGTAANTTFNLWDGVDYLTIQELLDEITDAFDVGVVETSTATMVNGEIRLTDMDSGFSETEIILTYNPAAAGVFELPKFFDYLSVGGEVAHRTVYTVYDPLGIAHTLSATFVKRDVDNTWDLVLTSITGDVTLTDRRVNEITFQFNGSYGGIGGAIPDDASFQLLYGADPALHTINLDFGTVAKFDGLTQNGEPSTAAPSGQDGYASGSLSTISLSSEGVLVGGFTNGIRRDIAAIRLSTFQNPAGLESIGNNYFLNSSNSGDPVPTRGLSGGAGKVVGGSLERSNVEIAQEFVNLIQAQNGFQANARTIRIANEVLRELTSIIR